MLNVMHFILLFTALLPNTPVLWLFCLLACPSLYRWNLGKHTARVFAT